MASHSVQRRSADIERPPLGRIYAVLLAILIAAALVSALVEMMLGYSVLLGGLVSVIPNSYFARQAFRYRGARSAHYIARAFYLGEAGKFAMTAAAFGLVFSKVDSLQPMAFILAFLGMTLSHLIVCACYGAFGRVRTSQPAPAGAAD